MTEHDDTLNSQKQQASEQQDTVEKGFWDKVRQTVGHVPFVPDAVALYFCAIDIDTPLWAKIASFSALAYFINPADAIPDIVPLVGYGDDLGAITVAVSSLAPFIT